MTAMTPQQYRALLTAALPNAEDADTIEPDPRTLFTPSGHRRALDPDVTIVRGGRGVGKTVWFKALQSGPLRDLSAEEYQLDRLHRVEPLPGYGSRHARRYPSQRVLQELLRSSTDPFDIWTAVALVALEHGPMVALQTWSERVAWLQGHPEEADAAFIEADESASAGGTTKLLLFDALDRLHTRREDANLLVRGILRLALDLRTGYRNLRVKIFIRPDMLNDEVLHFPDSSKLGANSVELMWPEANLYGLLFHQLGNASSDWAPIFRARTGRWQRRPTESDERYNPPQDLVGARVRQQEIFTWLAGQYMGTEYRKGHTYTWLPNHLADGLGQVSPRSFLSALRKATDITAEQYANHQLALHWDGIRRGVQTASQIRVKEIAEDIPWVAEAIRPLEGLQVPIDPPDVISRWEERGLQQTLEGLRNMPPSDEEDEARPTGPTHGRFAELIEELIQIGVMTRRANGRLDLPDVYRVAFGLGRRGGIPRAKG
jgi:hypothetical protein